MQKLGRKKRDLPALSAPTFETQRTTYNIREGCNRIGFVARLSIKTTPVLSKLTNRPETTGSAQRPVHGRSAEDRNERARNPAKIQSTTTYSDNTEQRRCSQTHGEKSWSIEPRARERQATKSRTKTNRNKRTNNNNSRSGTNRAPTNKQQSTSMRSETRE